MGFRFLLFAIAKSSAIKDLVEGRRIYLPTEKNKVIFNAFAEEVWNRKNVAAVDKFIAPRYAEHDLTNPDHVGDRESSKQVIASFISAFSDGHVTYNDMIAEGDKVVVRLTYRGTHKGEFMGIAVTGFVKNLSHTEQENRPQPFVT
jgi:predicted ester cyclase